MDVSCVINWALGLIATDGCIQYGRRKHPLICIVSSVERDWVDAVVLKLKKINVETTVHTYKKRSPHHRDLHNVHVVGGRFKSLVNQFGDKSFCSPRKWALIEKSLGYPNTGLKWGEDENNYLRENYDKLPDKELTMMLRRPWRGIQKQRRILGLIRIKTKQTKKAYKIARELREQNNTYKEIKNVLKDNYNEEVSIATIGRWCIEK